MYKATLNNIKWDGDGPRDTTVNTKTESIDEAIAEAEEAYGVKVLKADFRFTLDIWRNEIYDSTPKELRIPEKIIEKIIKNGIEWARSSTG